MPEPGVDALLGSDDPVEFRLVIGPVGSTKEVIEAAEWCDTGEQNVPTLAD